MSERTDVICADCEQGHGDTHELGVGWLHWQCLVTRQRKLLAEREETINQERLRYGRAMARCSVFMQAMASEARKDRAEWAQDWIRRADEASLRVKLSDFARVQLNTTPAEEATNG